MVDMPRSKSNPRALRAAENRVQAVQLRKLGYSTYYIADQLGVSHQAVSKMLNVALKELAEEQMNTTEELRALENTRLDHYLQKLEGMIEEGDIMAINTSLRISERRSKLNGLDGTQKVEHSGGVNISLQLADCSKKDNEPCNITPATQNSLKRLPDHIE
jgi:predicted transcriptional regulator